MVTDLMSRESKRPAGSISRREAPQMFDRIAHRYDFLNHFLSGNRDTVWRRQLAACLPNCPNLTVLDLATGTADQLLALHAGGRVERGVGIDLAGEMLAIGRQKIAAHNLASVLTLQTGDAEAIPFEDSRFDAASMSFGIRNVTDVPHTLREIHRVLKPGGRALILEFSLPTNSLIRTSYLFYFRHILPRLGALISGDRTAYRYLNATVETFPYGEAFCALMADAGFVAVHAQPVTFGIATIYQGDKR